jgi:hypothetical protein
LKNGRVIVLGDVHAPYHHKKAFGAALNLVAGEKKARVVQVGDFSDNMAFSRHGRKFGLVLDPERDAQITEKCAEDLESAAGGTPIDWLEGNHDAWLTRFVAQQAHEAQHMIKRGMAASESPIYDQVPYQHLNYIGHVAFTHDQGFAGLNATRQTMDAVGHCVVHGHDHRATLVFGGDVEGQRWFGLGVGFLGDESKMTYAPPARRRQWQLALGVVDFHAGLAYPRLVPWVDNKFNLDGKVYR